MEGVTFQHGNKNDIINSIKSKLLVLPEDTLIYPGHGYTRNNIRRKRIILKTIFINY